MRQNRFLETDLGESTVSDLLASKRIQSVFTVSSQATMGNVVRTMREQSISQLPVVDDGKLVGLITEFALLEHMVHANASADDPIDPLVSKEHMEVVSPRNSLEALAEVFNRGHIAVVLDEDSVSGIVTKIDLIGFLAERPS
jgi:cystathionine beta-synthase